MSREYKYELMEEIKNRWSPRAFDPEKPLAEEDIYPLIEAANLAPSAFNSQPRRFIVAADPDSRQKVFDALNEGNQSWNKLVPAFVVFLVKAEDDQGRRSNWAEFDTGTSFGLFTLEAVRRGMHTHAMAGFDGEKIKQNFQLAQGLEPITIVAVGYYGDKRDLPERYQAIERPNARLPLEEMVI